MGNGTSGSVTGNILDNSALVFANSAAELYTGAISGSGQLIKNGPGTLQLAATHAYTGPTIINAGTVQLGYATVLVSSFGHGHHRRTPGSGSLQEASQRTGNHGHGQRHMVVRQTRTTKASTGRR